MGRLPYPGPASEAEFFEWSNIEGARNPGNWIAHGKALMASSRAIREAWAASVTRMAAGIEAAAARGWPPGSFEDDDHEEGIRRSANIGLMLAGQALEDLLKALIVARDPTVVGPGRTRGRLFDEGLGHNLVALAEDERTGAAISDAERDLLHRLTEFVKWAGRYPLAMTFDAMRRPDLRMVNDSEFPAIDALYERFRDLAWRVLLDEYTPRYTAEECRRSIESRKRAIDWLAEHADAQQQPDGTVRYVARSAEDDIGSGGVIACCACGLQVNLSGRVRAATCGCSATLYFVDRAYHGGREPTPHTWVFKEDGSV
jgi:hypothetical protein